MRRWTWVRDTGRVSSTWECSVLGMRWMVEWFQAVGVALRR